MHETPQPPAALATTVIASPVAPATGGASPPRPRWSANTLLVALTVGAMLYLGQAILVPLALAVLLAFVLDPIVGALRRVGLPRTPAVVLVMLATVVVLGATALFVAGQVSHLAKNLPTYQTTVQGKLRALRHGLAAQSGSLDATSRLLHTVGGELDAARRDSGIL